MADNPKSVSDSTSLRISCEIGLEEPINANEMSISHRDEVSASDSFIVDLGRFSDGLGHSDKETMSANSRITVKMPRSFSRKGSQIDPNGVADSSSNGNKTATTSLAGGCSAENSKFTISPSIPSETKQFSTTTTLQGTHQIINIPGETKLRKLYSRQRSWNARLINPRRVLFFFATISSMGTLLLLYFTLSIARAEMES